MSHSQIVIFSCLLALLIVLSGFFSFAETALMAVNRYRLRHKARLKKRYAVVLLKLLKRPDRVLGMVLIGNNLANIVASALATMLALYLFGEKGVVISTTLLTFIVLIFAEVAPKTVAALYADKVVRIVAWPIYILLMVFYPFVWLINAISNGILRIFRIKVGGKQIDALTRDELRSVVYDTTGKMAQYQSMLLGILDLNKVSVDDVMIPRHEIHGVDIEEPWQSVLKDLSTSPHDWLPVYKESINEVIGFLHLRDLTARMIAGRMVDKEILLKALKEPYFIPQGTPLNVQLLNFQRQRKRLALVVDEYGEIQGLVTLEDILEEIVGEFTTNVPSSTKIQMQDDNSYLVDGSITLRELNKVTGWEFPVRGPRTLNGLIIEYLEMMPKEGISLKITEHPVEIIQVKENRVAIARVFPKLNASESES